MCDEGAFVSLLWLFETSVILEETASFDRTRAARDAPRPPPAAQLSAGCRAPRHAGETQPGSTPRRGFLCRRRALRCGAVSLRPEPLATPGSAVSPNAEAPLHETPALAGVRQSRPRAEAGPALTLRAPSKANPQ